MQKEKIVVLGISLGTRRLGISVMQDGELLDWRMTVFKGKWSEVKLGKILGYLRRCINKHSIKVIVLKVPCLIESSPGLQTLITELKEKFTSKDTTVVQYNVTDLKRFCFPNQRCSKKALVEYISQKFPEVQSISAKEKHNLNPYYIPLFEAITASYMYQELQIPTQKRRLIANKKGPY